MKYRLNWKKFKNLPENVILSLMLYVILSIMLKLYVEH